MGNEFSTISDYGSASLGISYKLNNGLFKISNGYATYLAEEARYSIMLNSELEYAGVSDKDDHYNHFGISESIHLTSPDEQSFFYSLGAGIDASTNRNFTQHCQYDAEVGPYIKFVPTEDNKSIQMEGAYGPHFVNNSEDVSHSNTSFDIGLSASAHVGVANVDGNRVFAFGEINKEITNKRNTLVKFGAGCHGSAEILGQEVNLWGRAGYQKNLSGNTTSNLSKHSGAFLEIGVGMNF